MDWINDLTYEYECPFCGSEIHEDMFDLRREYKCGTIYSGPTGKLFVRGEKCLKNTQLSKE